MKQVLRIRLMIPILLFSAVIMADDEVDYLEARQLVKAGVILPLAQVLRQLERPVGRVLEVELEHKGNGYRYEIELLDRHGQVWELKVDAVSGRLLKQEQED